LQIPSATVTDMSVFNQYFPAKLPLQLINGEADLTADIELKPETAGGLVKLNTRELRARVDNQNITADLAVAIKLTDGVPKNLDFDISGSSLSLNQVKIKGKETSFEQSDWNISFDLKNGRTVWKKPVRIWAEAEIKMKDTRPIVAVMANQRGKHGWLEKMLTIEDIRGEGSLEMALGQVVIPYAFVGSGKVDVGVKGTFDRHNRDGVFYARYRKLKGLLKIKDGKRNFDIFRARKQFDEYSTPALNLESAVE